MMQHNSRSWWLINILPQFIHSLPPPHPPTSPHALPHPPTHSNALPHPPMPSHAIHPTPFHAISHCFMPHHVPHHSMPFHAIPRHSTPLHATPHHSMPFYTIPRHSIPSYPHTVQFYPTFLFFLSLINFSTLYFSCFQRNQALKVQLELIVNPSTLQKEIFLSGILQASWNILQLMPFF